jgi:carbon monoxide dehydrogenase subunit G
MILEGQFSLKAPIQKVWDFLLEPGTLASCIPGAEKIEQIDEKTYDAIVKQKVGPISVKLKFTTVLTEVEPPTHIKAAGKGADMGKAGHFSHEIVVDIAETSQEEVEISYKADVNIVGRLATFGERIMRAKAKSVGEEFTQNLQNKLLSLES